MKKTLFILAVTTLLLAGCEKDPAPVTTTGFTSTNLSGVIISNQGNFGGSNSSITYIQGDNTVYDDLYFTVNRSTLGDILQSTALINSKLYFVVNNSSKIEVCDALTLQKIKTISINSPRYITQINSSKAYVTDYSSNISILDLNADSIIGTINVSGWTEDMVSLNGKIYVNSNRSDKVYVIDPNSDQLIDSIPAARYGNYLTSDINGNLWLLCTGDFSSVAPQLLRINPTSRQIEFTHTFTLSDYPALLKKNQSGNEIYFINSDLYKIGASDSTYPTQPFIAANGRYLYGLGIDPNNNIYISDAINFAQKGKVYKYNSAGTLLKQFDAGIAPGDFCFLPN